MLVAVSDRRRKVWDRAVGSERLPLRRYRVWIERPISGDEQRPPVNATPHEPEADTVVEAESASVAVALAEDLFGVQSGAIVCVELVSGNSGGRTGVRVGDRSSEA
jgi:hypothetical protein